MKLALFSGCSAPDHKHPRLSHYRPSRVSAEAGLLVRTGEGPGNLEVSRRAPRRRTWPLRLPGRYHRPRCACATRSHDLGGSHVLGALSPRGRTGDAVRPSLAHSHHTPSVDRDSDGRPSRCKAGRIAPPHLWAFEAEQRRSPTAIRVRATLPVSDRLPVYLLPWIYVRRSLYAVPRHRAGHRDCRTAIPVHITQTAVPVDLRQNALAHRNRPSACISLRMCHSHRDIGVAYLSRTEWTLALADHPPRRLARHTMRCNC